MSTFDIKKELLGEEEMDLLDECHDLSVEELEYQKSPRKINLKLKTEEGDKKFKIMPSSFPSLKKASVDKEKEKVLSDDNENLLDKFETEDNDDLDFWSYLEKCADGIGNEKSDKANEATLIDGIPKEDKMLSYVSGDKISNKGDEAYLSDITSLSSGKSKKSLSEISDVESFSEVSEISLSSLSEVSEDEMDEIGAEVSLPKPGFRRETVDMPGIQKPDETYFANCQCDLEKMKEKEGYKEVGKDSENSSLLKQIDIRDTIITELFSQIQDLITHGKDGEHKFHKAMMKANGHQTHAQNLEYYLSKSNLLNGKLKEQLTFFNEGRSRQSTFERQSLYSNASYHIRKRFNHDRSPRRKRGMFDVDYSYPSTSSSKYPKFAVNYSKEPSKDQPPVKYQNTYQLKLAPNLLKLKNSYKANLARLQKKDLPKSDSLHKHSPLELHMIGDEWTEKLRISKDIPDSLGLSTSYTYYHKDVMKNILEQATKRAYSQCNNIMVFSVISYAYSPLKIGNQKFIVPNVDFDFHHWRKWVKELHAAIIKSNPQSTLYVFIPPKINPCTWNASRTANFESLGDIHPELLPENIEDYSEKLSMLFSVLPHLPTEKGLDFFDGQTLICDPKDRHASRWLDDYLLPTVKYAQAFWQKVASTLKHT